jgi:ferredoxin
MRQEGVNSMDMTRREFIASTAAGISALALGGPHALGRGDPEKYTKEELVKMKEEVVRRMKEFGAYDVRIADPTRGFEHGLPERHPMKIWPECRSVLSVIVPNPPDKTFVPENERNEEDIRRIANNVAPGNTRIYTINRRVPPLMSRALPAGGRFLMQRGFRVETGTGPKKKSSGGKKEELQYKLCAYEAGIGVYGRSGFIVHPELGNRMCILALMTDAPLPPDGKREVKLGCEDCGECVKSCPAGSYDLKKTYPESYDMRTCARNRHKVLMTEGTLCQSCFATCKACKTTDIELEWWLEDKSAEVARKVLASPEGRLPGKVEKFHRAFRKWREAGGDPTPVVRLMRDFEPLIKKGRLREAEALIDRAMELMKK